MLKLNNATKSLLFLFVISTHQAQPLTPESARMGAFGVGIATFFGSMAFYLSNNAYKNKKTDVFCISSMLGLLSYVLSYKFLYSTTPECKKEQTMLRLSSEFADIKRQYIQIVGLISRAKGRILVVGNDILAHAKNLYPGQECPLVLHFHEFDFLSSARADLLKIVEMVAAFNEKISKELDNHSALRSEVNTFAFVCKQDCQGSLDQIKQCESYRTKIMKDPRYVEQSRSFDGTKNGSEASSPQGQSEADAKQKAEEAARKARADAAHRDAARKKKEAHKKPANASNAGARTQEARSNEQQQSPPEGSAGSRSVPHGFANFRDFFRHIFENFENLGARSDRRQGESRTSGTPPRTSNGDLALDEAYAFLGLAKNADKKAVEKVYRQLALTWHPDKWADKSKQERDSAEIKFKALGHARDLVKAHLERIGQW